jgi:hypothetical protein
VCPTLQLGRCALPPPRWRAARSRQPPRRARAALGIRCGHLIPSARPRCARHAGPAPQRARISQRPRPARSSARRACSAGHAAFRLAMGAGGPGLRGGSMSAEPWLPCSVLAGCSESARQRPARIPIHYMHAPAGHLVQASSRAAFSGLSRCPGGRVEYRTAAWYGCLHSLADPVGGRCRPAYPRGCGPVRGSQRLGAGHGSRGRPRGPVPAADPGHIGPRGDLVVLEGHARLTAFMLARDRLPPELEVLVGSSPAMTHWGLW